jgi:LuxR family maltose regulon positive regulatory protein
MLAQVDLLRANHARHNGQVDLVITLCQQVLDRLPENERYIRSGTMAHLASAYESTGSLQAAAQLFGESIRMCRAADNVDALLFASTHLIEVCTLSGQLRQAESVFEQTKDFAESRSGPDMGMIYISMAAVYVEQNKLAMAKRYLNLGMDLCRPFEAWQNALIAGGISSARLLAAEGQLDEAIEILLDIEKQYRYTKPLATAYLESFRARLQLRQGNYSAAARWAAGSGLSAVDAADYAREPELLSFSRLLMAQAALEAQGLRPEPISPSPVEAVDKLLQRLYEAALAGGRTGRVIEIRMLQALAQYMRQDTVTALRYLEAALTLAEPEAYIRLFVDEEPLLYPLLTTLRTRPVSATISLDYLDTLHDAFPRSVRLFAVEGSPVGSELTESERNALRLLASDRSIEEIAVELSVAVSTVRTYAKRIYSKLDVHSRAEAVYRARALKLL